MEQMNNQTTFVRRNSSTGKSLLRRFGPELILIPGIFIAFVLIWHLVVTLFGIRSVILPGPEGVWRSLVRGLNPASPANYYTHIVQTLGETLGGYLIGVVAGIILALLLSQISLLDRVIRPYIVAFQSIPKIAIAPLFIIWLGFGASSKVALVVLLVFFPVLVSGYTGFKSVEPERLGVMRSFGASRWQIFTKLVLPGSLPFLFNGLEVSLIHGMTATIVGEFLAGRAGLGVIIVQMEQVLDTSGIFSVLVILAVMGWALTAVLGLIRRRLTFWSTSERGPKR